MQLFGNALRGGDDEESVRRTAARRAARRLGHRRGVGVDADDEGAGLRACPAEDRPTIAGPEVDDDPVGAGDPVAKLADVHLGDPPAGHDAHRAGIYTPPVSEAQLGPGERPIGPYERKPVSVAPWDPNVVLVADRVIAIIGARRPELHVEHIGSTAVPDLPGKGIVDLSTETDPAAIPGVTSAMYDLGFGPQQGPDPWPPERPMLVGSYSYEGVEYRVHSTSSRWAATTRRTSRSATRFGPIRHWPPNTRESRRRSRPRPTDRSTAWSTRMARAAGSSRRSTGSGFRGLGRRRHAARKWVREGGAVSQVGIIVGSRSDIEVAQRAAAVLGELEVDSEIRVISAHRAPDLLGRFVAGAGDRGIGVFIAIAGLAAHLPGVVASQTTLPVIGVAMPGGVADGLDALLAIVQMPKGVPVAAVGVGNGENAALLAAQILAVGDPELRGRLVARRAAQARAIEEDPANEGL